MGLGARSATLAASAGRPLPVWRARARSLLQYFGKLDVLVLFVWVASTTLQLDWMQPLRYLAAAYFLGSLVMFARQTMPAVGRAWPTLLIPLFCIVSALWAPSASDAIRKGLLFAMTSAVAIYAATRVSGRNILLVFMGCETIAAIMTLRSPQIIDGAWTGIFGQKNFLAVNMFILYTCALAVLLDKGSWRWFRLAALGIAPLALALIFLAKSGTTTIMVIGATGALIGHAFLWQPARRIRHMRLLLVMAGAVFALIIALVLFGFMQFDAQTSVLNALGKDSTLTGRTYLWETAQREMAENPLLGRGADGFWRSEYGAANSIIKYFHYDHYVKFSFHNSYLENGVAFGYPGYWATVFLAIWALWRTGMNWLKNQDAINAAFLILAAMVIVRSTTEIDLALEFSATATLLFMGAVRREKVVGPHGAVS
jgi:exopolysaccharide production protein ExoQ